jgi:hypothetical protein
MEDIQILTVENIYFVMRRCGFRRLPAISWVQISYLFIIHPSMQHNKYVRDQNLVSPSYDLSSPRYWTAHITSVPPLHAPEPFDAPATKANTRHNADMKVHILLLGARDGMYLSSARHPAYGESNRARQRRSKTGLQLVMDGTYPKKLGDDPSKDETFFGASQGPHMPFSGRRQCPFSLTDCLLALGTGDHWTIPRSRVHVP